MARNRKNIIRVIVRDETGQIVDILEAVNTRRAHVNARDLKRWGSLNWGSNDEEGAPRFEVVRRAITDEDRRIMALCAASHAD